MNISKKQLCVLAAFLIGVAVMYGVILAVGHHAKAQEEQATRLPFSLFFAPSTEELTFVPADGFSVDSITVNNGEFTAPPYDETSRSVTFPLRTFFQENAGTEVTSLDLYILLHGNGDVRPLQFRISRSQEKQALVVDIYPSGDYADPTGSTTEEFPLAE